MQVKTSACFLRVVLGNTVRLYRFENYRYVLVRGYVDIPYLYIPTHADLGNGGISYCTLTNISISISSYCHPPITSTSLPTWQGALGTCTYQD